MAKIAIISGPLGQDGTYLTELLLKKNYKVYGILNPKKKFKKDSFINSKNFHLINNVDINNFNQIKKIIRKLNLLNSII